MLQIITEQIKLFIEKFIRYILPKVDINKMSYQAMEDFLIIKKKYGY